MKTKSIHDRTTVKFEIPAPVIRLMHDEASAGENKFAAALRRLAAALALL